MRLFIIWSNILKQGLKGVKCMRIKSAVDLWYNILIWITAVILIISIIIIPQNQRLIGSAAVFPILIFLFWIYFGTYYELQDSYLYCKSGPFFEKILYDKIRSVRLSENMLSSMALSRKRIEIRQHGKGYLTGTTLISPENREEFLTELVKKCKNID
jgi:uncharacterized membrane protein YobD (UPF0266 family)